MNICPILFNLSVHVCACMRACACMCVCVCVRTHVCVLTMEANAMSHKMGEGTGGTSSAHTLVAHCTDFCGLL